MGFSWNPGRYVSLYSVLVLIALAGVGCGYRVASKNRIDAKFQSIAVQTFENETTTFEVEQIFTRALIQELATSSNLDIQNEPGSADLVLEGRITQVSVSPVAFGKTAFASTFVLSVSADVGLKNRRTGEIVFRNSRYLFRDQYVINVDVENFFSEENPALSRISQDFASSLVATMLEDF